MVYGELYNKYKGCNIFNNYTQENDISDSLIEEDVVYNSDDITSIYVEALYMMIHEEFNYSFILESAFGEKIKEYSKKIKEFISTIIDKFITILKAIWNKFSSLCMGILSKAGAVKKYKNSIMKLSEPLYYSAPHYNYTNIREDKSRTSFDIEINSIYDKFLKTLDCIKSMNTYGNIQSKIEEFESEFGDGISYYDSLRGKIVGKEICKKEDYAKELYRYFRDGQDSPIENEHISPDRIKTMLTNLESTKNTKAISNDKAEIEKQANKIKAKYKATNLENYIGNNESSSEISSIYKKCIDNNIQRTTEICNAFLQYYAAKLDAAKEEYSNNLRILYAAAQEAVRKGL